MEELLKAAGTVTGKLPRWLEQQGHIDSDAAEVAIDRARDSARELPAADRLTDVLAEVVMRAPDIDVDDLSEEDWLPVAARARTQGRLHRWEAISWTAREARA